MNKTNLVLYVLEKYQQGVRYFDNLDRRMKALKVKTLKT